MQAGADSKSFIVDKSVLSLTHEAAERAAISAAAAARLIELLPSPPRPPSEPAQHSAGAQHSTAHLLVVHDRGEVALAGEADQQEGGAHAKHGGQGEGADLQAWARVGWGWGEGTGAG